MNEFLTYADILSGGKNFYPGLFGYNKGELCLSDKNISSGLLVIDSVLDNKRVVIKGDDFRMVLPVVGNGVGYLYMDYDFGIPIDSCMGLYDHNIEIYYMDKNQDPHTVPEYIQYDRKEITRKYTIKNIINE